MSSITATSTSPSDRWASIAFSNPVVVHHILDYLALRSTYTVRRLSRLNRFWHEACNLALPQFILHLSVPDLGFSGRRRRGNVSDPFPDLDSLGPAAGAPADEESFSYRLLCIDSSVNDDGVRIWLFVPSQRQSIEELGNVGNVLMNGTDVFCHSAFGLAAARSGDIGSARTVECVMKEFDPERPFCTGRRKGLEDASGAVGDGVPRVDEALLYFRAVKSESHHQGWSNDYRFHSIWITDALLQHVMKNSAGSASNAASPVTETPSSSPETLSAPTQSIWPSRIDRWFGCFGNPTGPVPHPSVAAQSPTATGLLDPMAERSRREFLDRIARTWPGVRCAFFDQGRRCELFLLSIIGNLTDHGNLGIDRRLLSTCMFLKSSVGDAIDAIRRWHILDAATVDSYMDGSGAEGARSVMISLVEAFWRHDCSSVIMESIPPTEGGARGKADGGSLTPESPVEDVFNALVFLHKALLHGMFFRPYEIAPDGDLYEIKGCPLFASASALSTSMGSSSTGGAFSGFGLQRHPSLSQSSSLGNASSPGRCKLCEWNRSTLFPVRIDYFKSEDFVELATPMREQAASNCTLL
ncbi:hypothetical protein HDU96_005924 [Phlyctochytrium bullatum]|nr:hypothetical protein HDU96_005924 [Phlyctochytrium bullatum]